MTLSVKQGLPCCEQNSCDNYEKRYLQNEPKWPTNCTQTLVNGGYKKCHLKQFLTQENVAKKRK